MAEARQSPFHASAALEDLAVLQTPISRLPYSSDLRVPDPANGPSFQRVLWPTLGATVASWAVAVGLAPTDVCLTVETEDWACPDHTIEVATIAATLALLPPLATKLAGASFPKALLGSLAGSAGGLGVGALGL